MMSATVTTTTDSTSQQDPGVQAERRQPALLNFFSDTWLIFGRQMRLSLRNPAWVIIGLIQPILYLAFFGPLLARRVLRDMVTLTVQAVVLVLAGLAFGLRAPVGGVLISLGFVAVVAVTLSAVSYSVGLLLKSEDALAPLLNMVMVPLMLLSGIMLPMTIGPHWLRAVAKVTPFGYIINAMRGAFAGHYFT